MKLHSLMYWTCVYVCHRRATAKSMGCSMFLLQNRSRILWPVFSFTTLDNRIRGQHFKHRLLFHDSWHFISHGNTYIHLLLIKYAHEWVSMSIPKIRRLCSRYWMVSSLSQLCILVFLFLHLLFYSLMKGHLIFYRRRLCSCLVAIKSLHIESTHIPVCVCVYAKHIKWRNIRSGNNMVWLFMFYPPPHCYSSNFLFVAHHPKDTQRERGGVHIDKTKRARANKMQTHTLTWLLRRTIKQWTHTHT